MNLKSVSPIVSVVLLIVTTIAIGTILMAWGSGLLQEKQSVSEETSKAVFGNENYLSIDNLANSSGNLLIWIRNSGDEDVNVEYFRIYITKNEIEQNPIDVSGVSVPKGGTVQIADVPLSLQEGDTVFVKITTKSGYVMTKSLNLAPKVTSTLSPPPTTPPANQPPNADTDGPYSGNRTETITLDGTGSTDPDGTIDNYAWEVDALEVYSGPNATYDLDLSGYSLGDHPVTLTVTDNDSAIDTDSTTLTVSNAPPAADADGHYSGTKTDTVTLDGSGSNDLDGTIDNYAWEVDALEVYSGPNATYDLDLSGYSLDDHPVTLTVTDNDSAIDTDSTTLTVNNALPVADANGPYSGDVGENITFDGSGSYDPDGTIVSWHWDFGDTTTGSGETTTHAYSSTGNYTVTLTVTDNDGGTGIDTASVYVGDLEYNNDAVARDGPDTPSPDRAGGVEFSITNTFASTVTINKIKIDPVNNNINELDDQYGGGNDEKTEVEIYAEAPVSADSYSDWGTSGSDYEALAIGVNGVEAAVGIDGDNTNSGNLPQIQSGESITWYLYEFYEGVAGDYQNNTNLNMSGESIEITLTYTLNGSQFTKTFTIHIS